ncbi:MAG TPA: cbb3-type cytochrome c oxidase subunit II [Trueperaceae bacterium]|jgi:cytochrome c oxidase cbb3-type subunit 2
MNMHSNHRLLFATILLGFLALSGVIAVAPAVWVENNTAPLPGSEPLTALERQGLGVYVSEGCVACHTQQVRPIAMDSVWGRPSVPGDYARVEPAGALSPYAPAVLGSSRTGPDLTNVGARQASDTWHYLHLFNPRIVVPDSVMPAYPWLFEVVDEAGEGDVVVPVSGEHAPDEGQVVASERARALVAYLLSLKQLDIEATSGHSAGGEAQ